MYTISTNLDQVWKTAEKSKHYYFTESVWISTYLFPNQSGLIDTDGKRDESSKRDVITVKQVISV